MNIIYIYAYYFDDYDGFVSLCLYIYIYICMYMMRLK